MGDGTIVVTLLKFCRLAAANGCDIWQFFNGATLRAWASLNATEPGALLRVKTGSHVTVRGLKFDGARVAQANPANMLAGVSFFGGSGMVENCVFEGFRGTTKLGSLWSTGTFAGCPDDHQGPPINVVLRDNVYRDNAVSIYLTGSYNNSDPSALRTTFAILDNVIEGIGATSLDFQLGMTINPGTSGLVKGNKVSEHYWTAINQRASAACVMTWEQFMIPHHQVRFEANSFIKNQLGIILSEADRAEIVGNTFEGRGRTANQFGLVMTGKSVVLAGNSFSKTTTGVYLAGDTGSGSVDTLLAGNRFCDVPTVLRKDANVTGTINAGQLGCEPDPVIPANFTLFRLEANAGERIRFGKEDGHLVSHVLFNGTPAVFSAVDGIANFIILEAIVPQRARDGYIILVSGSSVSISDEPFTRLHSLSVNRTQGSPLAVTWMQGAEDFILESSSHPSQGWQPMLRRPALVNGLFQFLPKTEDSMGFFRLHKH
jgi:hypothetical protein